MSLTLYDTLVFPLIRGLTNMADFLKKGEDWAKENGLPESKLTEAQLNPDSPCTFFITDNLN